MSEAACIVHAELVTDKQPQSKSKRLRKKLQEIFLRCQAAEKPSVSLSLPAWPGGKTTGMTSNSLGPIWIIWIF